MSHLMRHEDGQQCKGKRQTIDQKRRMQKLPIAVQVRSEIKWTLLIEAVRHFGAHNCCREQRQQKQQGMQPVAMAQTSARPRRIEQLLMRYSRRRRGISVCGQVPSYCSVCNSLPGLKRTALPGGMATSAPVRGLRPMPVLRGRTLKIPKPRSSMRSPFPSARFMLSKTVSTAISAFVFVIPVLLTTSLMMSSLIKAASWCYHE